MLNLYNFNDFYQSSKGLGLYGESFTRAFDSGEVCTVKTLGDIFPGGGGGGEGGWYS